MKFLIDGIDRLGKSTLAETIQQALGYHLYIHYSKPRELAAYKELEQSSNIKCLFNYQKKANQTMLKLLESDVNLIMDRTHLGEAVYSDLYRGYNGDYVFELERDVNPTNDTYLILLYSSNLNMLVDDGQSFDFSRRSEEQHLFFNAYEKSKLQKVCIDVCDNKGGYKDKMTVFREVMAFICEKVTTK